MSEWNLEYELSLWNTNVDLITLITNYGRIHYYPYPIAMHLSRNDSYEHAASETAKYFHSNALKYFKSPNQAEIFEIMKNKNLVSYLKEHNVHYVYLGGCRSPKNHAVGEEMLLFDIYTNKIIPNNPTVKNGTCLLVGLYQTRIPKPKPVEKVKVKPKVEKSTPVVEKRKPVKRTFHIERYEFIEIDNPIGGHVDTNILDMDDLPDTTTEEWKHLYRSRSLH